MNRGDVVEVVWPYSELTGSKKRPAVMVQADFLNGILDDTVLVQITGTGHGIPGTEVEIDPSNEPGSGLSRLCYASCANILTLEQAQINRTIGYLSKAALLQIGDCLKKVLALI